MSFNSSSSTNASLHPPHLLSSISSLDSASIICLSDRSSFFIFIIFKVTYVLLLLPLCVFILCLGLRERWKQRSAPAAVMSHADVFTYHTATMETIGIFGCGLYGCGLRFNVFWLMKIGVEIFSAATQIQVFFHILSCVERHLAVVHPITYLSLRKRSAVRGRNAFLWMLQFISSGLEFKPESRSQLFVSRFSPNRLLNLPGSLVLLLFLHKADKLAKH